MARSAKSPRAKSRTADDAAVRLYTLDVFVVSGPVASAFAKQNPVISRTIQIRGDQTLQDLHQAIFTAFDREEEHLYEFQFGKGPMDPDGPRYALPGISGADREEAKPPAGLVTDTTLASLGLTVGKCFGYWFDFGDDWWHQLNVEAIEDQVPPGPFPRVTKRVGASPPQYADLDEEDGEEGEEDGGEDDPDDDAPALREAETADAACLVGEMHLKKKAYDKAIEAFTRALATRATADAYQGRAQAYRGLADEDEHRAAELR